MMEYPTHAQKLTAEDLKTIQAVTLRKIRTVRPAKDAWSAGMSWYQKAHEFCVGLAEIVSIPATQLGWALAALSPLNNWRQNKVDLVDLVTTGDCKALGPCRPKALAVLAGEEPAEVLGGSKVLAFGDNIVRPEKSLAVTLDSHMAKLFGLPGEYRYLERAGVYEAVSAAFRQSAKNRGILPHQLQATLWIHQRGRP